MICTRCMYRLSIQHTPRFASILTATTQNRLRTFTTTQAGRISAADPTTPAPQQGSPSDSRHPPAATSTSAAQPFSTPLTPAPPRTPPPVTGNDGPPVVSSVPAGTPLKGINFFKNKSDPIALDDADYPAWLWTILKPKRTQETAAAESADLYSKSKKQRRAAAKRQRKEEESRMYEEKKVPLYEQTVDLPTSDGTLEGAANAEAAQKELQRAMRKKRKADIKEANFLRTMR